MVTQIKSALVIDDDEVFQNLTKRMISRTNLVGDVTSFHYADEALEYMKSSDIGDIDVIFLDINMPRMDGFEFLDAAVSEFGTDFTKVVVIMLTTSLRHEDTIRAQNYKVIKEYFHKPLTFEHLQQVAKLI